MSDSIRALCYSVLRSWEVQTRTEKKKLLYFCSSCTPHLHLQVRESSQEQKENLAHPQSLGSKVTDIKVTPVTCVLAPGTSGSAGDLNTFSV